MYMYDGPHGNHQPGTKAQGAAGPGPGCTQLPEDFDASISPPSPRMLSWIDATQYAIYLYITDITIAIITVATVGIISQFRSSISRCCLVFC